MARMTEIDVYNICLEAIGQRPISGNTVSVADKWIAQIQRHVNNARRSVLLNDGRGWTFNRETITLSPDASVNGYLPTTAYLAVKLGKPYIERSYSGTLCVYDPSIGTYPTTAMTNVIALKDLDWVDIPDEAKEAIAYRAAVSFIVSSKGSVPEANFYNGKEIEAFARLEHNFADNNDAGSGTGSNGLLGEFNR